jgi:hypothetical protein
MKVSVSSYFEVLRALMREFCPRRRDRLLSGPLAQFPLAGDDWNGRFVGKIDWIALRNDMCARQSQAPNGGLQKRS